MAATSVWHLLTMRAEALAAQAATGSNVAGQQVGPWLHAVVVLQLVWCLTHCNAKFIASLQPLVSHCSCSTLPLLALLPQASALLSRLWSTSRLLLAMAKASPSPSFGLPDRLG